MDATVPQARLSHPALVLPGAMDALQALGQAISKSSVAPRTLELVNLRASQINGCGVCAVQHPRIARELGESDDRLFAARHYDESELAALVLAIASINAWNRLNVITGQVAGQGW